MDENLEQSVEQEHNSMRTSVKKPIIVLPVNNIDYNSREFKKGLEKIRKENEQSTEYQKPNREKMYDTFDI